MALITKQRMMDNGVGLDYISLSQPPLHSIPLFLVSCRYFIVNTKICYVYMMSCYSHVNVQIADFYEVPHWVNIGFVDSEQTKENYLSASLVVRPKYFVYFYFG